MGLNLRNKNFELDFFEFFFQLNFFEQKSLFSTIKDSRNIEIFPWYRGSLVLIKLFFFLFRSTRFYTCPYQITSLYYLILLAWSKQFSKKSTVFFVTNPKTILKHKIVQSFALITAVLFKATAAKQVVSIVSG